MDTHIKCLNRDVNLAWLWPLELLTRLMLTLLAGFGSASGSQPANGFWKDIASLDFDAVAQDMQNCPSQPAQDAPSEAAKAEPEASQHAQHEQGKHRWLCICNVIDFMPF